MTANGATRPRTKRKAEPAWATMPDEELLQVRLKDLRIKLEGTWLADCLQQVNDEVAARGLLVRAHGWFSDEWFSPHASPGVAFPFYLAHPRLAQLERKMLLEVEGGTARECMKLLRHELGHVVQYAFKLHRLKRWKELFGRASKPYPDSYRPNPASKNYVQHLRRWYAQCHPDEDFAETFAVWLTPRSNWRARYAEWPVALKKLEYVDELMSELVGVRPLPFKRFEVDPVGKLEMTLGEHYDMKRERFAVDTPTIFDRDLKRIFVNGESHGAGVFAATVIKRNRKKIRQRVADGSGEYPYALEAAIDDMIHRSQALKLRALGSERTIRADVTALLTKKAVHSFYSTPRKQTFAV